jgi:hypothetical protein
LRSINKNAPEGAFFYLWTIDNELVSALKGKTPRKRRLKLSVEDAKVF